MRFRWRPGPMWAAEAHEQDAHHRAAMPGMDPARVDLMPYSAALIQWVLGHGCIQRDVSRAYALREGVLSRIERGLALAPSS